MEGGTRGVSYGGVRQHHGARAQFCPRSREKGASLFTIIPLPPLTPIGTMTMGNGIRSLVE